MFNSGKVVKLYYDVASPYSWLAFEVLFRYRNVWNIDIKLKPAYLGGVIHGSGNQPPGFIPNKMQYMASDLKLLSEYFGVPIFKPPNLYGKGIQSTSHSLLPVHVCFSWTAVAEQEKKGDVLLERVSRELWKRMWCTHQDVTQPASFIEVGLKAGLSTNEAEEILTLAKSQPIKDKLKSVTKEALGPCFGLPFIVCHVNGKAEVFFGSDRFDLMAYFIGNYKDKNYNVDG
ncbi:glutathione S-transferase kappa 1-like [Siphateles boraxobius]|uniref:glutathione S-transferase kappa 1-like n=1 Tax=Siphateles boraxobius TaxID=180520 RepID=UPI004062C742